jgi:PAS domain-containing protein
MSLRERLADAVVADPAPFREQAAAIASAFDLPETDRRLAETDPESFDGPAALSAFESLPVHARRLVWRLWLFDTAPVGLTLCGPAYEDTPLLYATATFRELTGYSMARLRGANPRLLQGPATESEPVATLREAVSIWEPRTVELTNYHADGTAFRNRVSLVPVPGADGTVRNWVGIQRAVSGE